MIGRRYGRLVVLSPQGKDSHNNTMWLCRCDCGKEKVIKRYQLTKGATKSCGCLRNEIRVQTHTKHNLSSHRLYHIWFAMKQRCNDENSRSFSSYGGRGISVCEEWLDFINFYEWALPNGYSENLTIERLDNNKGYCPSNCVWATKKQQARNKRNVPLIEYEGEMKSVAQLCEEYNINPETFRSRLKSGWTFEESLNVPVRKFRKPDTLQVK